MTKGVQAGPFGTPDRFTTTSQAGAGEAPLTLRRSFKWWVLNHQKFQVPNLEVCPQYLIFGYFGGGFSLKPYPNAAYIIGEDSFILGIS